MTDLRADSMTGEQYVFEERTADPSPTVEGERWLRTDLNSGDKLATLRVDVGGSTLDVPVFPTGTSEDGVTEALRVRVGSQTGYIPAIADTSTAGFPQLRLQHDGQVYGYHNEQGVFAFFDVAISSTNSPVNEGSDLNVDYSVQNTGFSANNTQDIRLQIDTVEEDRDSNITLSPGSSTTGTLTWNTPSSSAGTYNASVLSDDDTASTSVTVEAGPAIPDSVDHQYKAPEFATPWPDAIGNVDMSISGLTSSTFSNGEDSVAGDGASHGEADITDLGSQTQFGIAFTAEYSSISSQVYFLGQNDSGTNFSVETASGEVGLRINDGSNNIDAVSTDQYDDGSVHAIVINKTGNSASDIEIYVDDMANNEATVSISGTINPSAYSNSRSFYFFARNKDGSESGAIDADMGTIEINSSPYSQSEREAFVSRRPEV